MSGKTPARLEFVAWAPQLHIVECPADATQSSETTRLMVAPADRRLSGRNALVTGGSSGIGQAIAVRLAEEGANVGINYVRDESSAQDTTRLIDATMEECQRAVSACGVKRTLARADVAKADDVAAMFRDTIAELGGIDILINNAGVQVNAASHEMKAEDFDRVVATNLRGAFLCAGAAIGHWLKEGRVGIIVNVERPRTDPEAALRRLQRQQGRARQSHAHPRARVRRQRNPCDRRRPRRDRHADEPGLGR